MPILKKLSKSEINHDIRQLLLSDFNILWEQVIFGSLVLSCSSSLIMLGLIVVLKLKNVFSLIPLCFFFGTFVYLVRMYPQHYQKKSDEINKIFPLLRNCIDLFVTYLPKHHDKSLVIIQFLANVPSPIQPSFKKMQDKVQNGSLPEDLIQFYISPSKLLTTYLEAMVQSNFIIDHISLKIDNPLEDRYSTMSRTLESRVSLSFFFGIFIPLGFSLGVFLQKINGVFLLITSPLLFCILYFLTKQLSTDNSLLLGTLSHRGKEVYSEYSRYWDFFYILASKLPHMSPEFAIVQALESTSLKKIATLADLLNQFNTHSLSLDEFMGKIHLHIKGVRMKLIFGTMKFVILTNSDLASKNIIQLLSLLKHHQKLEIHRLQLIKAEIFKVKVFQIILPIVIALITAIFLYIALFFPNIFYLASFTISVRDSTLFCCNQILSVNISIHFFRKMVRLKNSLISVLTITGICIMGIIGSFFIIQSVSFLV